MQLRCASRLLAPVCEQSHSCPAHVAQVRDRPRLAAGAALQWQQLVALSRKNLTVRQAGLLCTLFLGCLIRASLACACFCAAANACKPLH